MTLAPAMPMPPASSPSPALRAEPTRDFRVVGLDLVPGPVARPPVVATREALLGDGPLAVPRPGGDVVRDAERHARAIAELRRATGAPWLTDAADASITLHDHLVSRGEREWYRRSGYPLVCDPPGLGYYTCDRALEACEVHATGQLGRWLAVAVAAPLGRAEAVAGGTAAARPRDALAVLALAAPELAARAWGRDASELPRRLVDTSLRTACGATLRAGVRQRGAGPATTYWYLVRVSLPDLG